MDLIVLLLKFKIMKISSIEIHNDQIGQWVKNKRINVLILRFIASLMVIAVHLRFILNLGSDHNTIAFSIVECISIIGVNIFIACTAISSFMKEKNNWKRYAKIVLILYVYFWIKQIVLAINHRGGILTTYLFSYLFLGVIYDI